MSLFARRRFEKSDAGEVVGVRADAEVNLSDAERTELLSSAIDALSLGVVICNNLGDVVFANQIAESLFSGSYQDALAAKALNEVIDLARLGNHSERTFELYGPPKRSYSIHSLPLYARTARQDFIAILEDVSNKKHLDDVRRDFVANVSHELKTPIAAMQLLAETMSFEDDSGVLKRLASRIENEAVRLNRIVDDLLDLSRIESDDRPTLELLNMNDLVIEAANRVRPSAELKAVSITVSELPSATAVRGDRRQLTSAVYNLLDNAVKYSEGGKEVRVTIKTLPDWLEIAVTDEGIGIPSRDQERIFERFYRVDQNRSRATGGTGLGLSIVRHVVNNHRGRITVESTEGIGSTFTLRFPLYSDGEV